MDSSNIEQYARYCTVPTTSGTCIILRELSSFGITLGNFILKKKKYIAWL